MIEADRLPGTVAPADVVAVAQVVMDLSPRPMNMYSADAQLLKAPLQPSAGSQVVSLIDAEVEMANCRSHWHGQTKSFTAARACTTRRRL